MRVAESDSHVAGTVAGLLAASASTVVGPSGSSRSAVEVLAAGERLARRLSAWGLRPGDRVAARMANTDTYVDLLAACAVGRFVLMSVNTRFADPLASSLIDRSGARLVVSGPEDLPTADGPAPELSPADADDRFVILTTSGTTSAPKLVAHTQRSIATHAREITRAFGHDGGTVALVAVPLCGTFGLTSLFAALASDATIVLDDFHAERSAALIEEHGVGVMHGTDDMFHRMLATGRDLSSLDHCGYARFNTSLDGIVERADTAGVTMAGLYGMSEVQALYAWRDPRRPVDERWVAGGALVSTDAACRVVDDELQLQGPSLFEGYLADGGAEIDVELTGRAFDGPWFRTGDHAEMDGDRSFRYVSRLGDALRLGGFLVAPAEIEGALCEHDGVAQAQVVAVDLPRGARPVAFVIGASGVGIGEDELIEHCRSRLATFKCPVRVVQVDAFPVTDGPNGVKVQRTRLREQALALFE